MAVRNDFTAGEVLAAADLNDTFASKLDTTAYTAPGLVLITDEAFTAVSAISINGCFSATYENYFINYTSEHTTSVADLNVRFRVSGSDNTTSNYNYVRQRISSAGSGFDTRSEARSTNLGVVASSVSPNHGHMYVMKPFAAEATGVIVAQVSPNVANSERGVFSFSSTTSFDGFTLYPASGAITGTIRVYGYKD